MGKYKGIKIPRKLKKEFRKIECMEQTQPYWNYHLNEAFTPTITKMTFYVNQRIKLKEGAKRNKWTKRLVNHIIREKTAFYAKVMDNMIKRQMDWAHKGISPINSFAEAMKRKSPDEFRREYLNEPIFEPTFQGMHHEPHGYDDAVIKGMPELGRYARGNEKPNFMIMDDLDELMPNIRTKREEAEWIERIKLWYSSMTQPDINGDCFAPNVVIKIKEGAIDPDKLEEFRKEWENQLKGNKPLILSEGTEVEFIPWERPHRLHNHPKMEMEFCNEQEVIVDVEYINMFDHRPLYNGKNGEIDPNHIIVLKDEYLARIGESRERERPVQLF